MVLFYRKVKQYFPVGKGCTFMIFPVTYAIGLLKRNSADISHREYAWQGPREPPMAKKEKVLFICVHNSARSQMAEAWLKHLAGDRFEVYSAGIEPGELNPVVVAVMAEIGIDISRNLTKSVADLTAAGHHFDYAITVCDDAQAESCPIFPGATRRLHWSLPDPRAIVASEEEKLMLIRGIRDRIRELVSEWCCQGKPDLD
jgi:arsenate reductase (thioredoxin)